MLFPLFWLGCDSSTVVGGDDKDASAGNPSDTGDSGVENIDGTDTADTGPVGDDTADTGAPAETTRLTWVVDGAWPGTYFGLVHLEPSDGGYLMGTVEWTSPVDATISLDVPAPRAELMAEIPELPGLEIAFFVGGLFVDDGDERWDADEVWVGVSVPWSLYIDGVVPVELLAIGIREGWNALALTSENPEAGDIEAMELAIRYRDEVTLGGTADETIAVTDRFAMLPASMFGGEFPARLYADQRFDDGKSWSVDIVGDPPEDHFADVDNDGVSDAFEIPYAYTDADASGGVSGDDTFLGAGCIDGDAAVAWWIEPPTDITYLSSVVSFGAGLGWNALLLGVEGPSAVVEDPSSNIVFSTSCVLPE